MSSPSLIHCSLLLLPLMCQGQLSSLLSQVQPCLSFLPRRCQGERDRQGGDRTDPKFSFRMHFLKRFLGIRRLPSKKLQYGIPFCLLSSEKRGNNKIFCFLNPEAKVQAKTIFSVLCTARKGHKGVIFRSCAKKECKSKRDNLAFLTEVHFFLLESRGGGHPYSLYATTAAAAILLTRGVSGFPAGCPSLPILAMDTLHTHPTTTAHTLATTTTTPPRNEEIAPAIH